jgi:AcrR family transcriptional regulator
MDSVADTRADAATEPQPAAPNSRVAEGARTREHILRQAAELFNRQGYAGASISDIMKATGLKKGGIYNHFTSKEQLWLESFDYAHQLVVDYFEKALQEQKDARLRLHAVIKCFLDYGTSPILDGGCPLLNTAIESDDTNPVLRLRVRSAFDDLGALIHRIVEKGVERAQLQPTAHPAAVAAIFLSSVEGAIMLSQLFDDRSYLDRVSEHLSQFVDTQLAA